MTDVKQELEKRAGSSSQAVKLTKSMAIIAALMNAAQLGLELLMGERIGDVLNECRRRKNTHYKDEQKMMEAVYIKTAFCWKDINERSDVIWNILYLRRAQNASGQVHDEQGRAADHP